MPHLDRTLKPRAVLTDSALEELQRRATPLSAYGKRQFERYIELRQGVQDAARQGDLDAYNSLCKDLEAQRQHLDWLASRSA